MRKITFTVVAASMTVFLTGCAQMRLDSAKKQRAAVNDICHSAWANPKLDSIRAQIPEMPKDVTVTQLADKRYATPEQSDAIEHKNEYLESCHAANLTFFSRFGPGARPVVENYYQLNKLLDAQLLSKKLTFGQYNQKRTKLSATTKQLAIQADQARVARDQQQYLQYQQSVLNSQSIMRSFTPTATNCYRYGNSVNCTSQ